MNICMTRYLSEFVSNSHIDWATLPGIPKVLSGALTSSQTYDSHSHGAPWPVIRYANDTEGRMEYPWSAWFSSDVDTSMFTLHLLSYTSGSSQWQNYMLLMHTGASSMPKHQQIVHQETFRCTIICIGPGVDSTNFEHSSPASTGMDLECQTEVLDIHKNLSQWTYCQAVQSGSSNYYADECQ